MVALLDPRAKALGGRDREAQLDLSALERPHDLEARIREDAERRAVLRHHLGDEARDPGDRGPLRELLQEAGADPAALLLVGDREGDLRHSRLAQARIAREGDDAVFERADEGAALDPVRVEERLDEPCVGPAHAVEAEVQASLGKVREERDEAVGVVAEWRPQPKRAAVPQDDVDRLGCGIRDVRRRQAPPAARPPQGSPVPLRARP